jgi:hypothetical protein
MDGTYRSLAVSTFETFALATIARVMYTLALTCLWTAAVTSYTPS